MKLTRVSTKQFTRTGFDFCAEISDMGPDFRVRRISPDSYDEGFILVSHRTGREVVMVEAHELRAKDGSLEASVFKAAPACSRTPNDPVRNITVTLFND